MAINPEITPVNVDPSEIAQFNAIADQWWDPDGKFKPLHDMNPLRANWIAQHCTLVDKKGLDVGCGGGILTEALCQRGAHMTGIDMSDKALGAARKHLGRTKHSIDYEQTTAEAWALTHQNHYDFVTCLEMLEHVPDPASVIKACFTLVKPGGMVFFSTINRNPKAYLFAIVGAEYVLKLLPKGTHQYKHFIKPSELGRWIRAAGANPGQLTGMTYNPLTQQFTLNQNVSVNYLLQASKPT